MNGITKNNYNPSFQAYYKSTFSKQLEKVLANGKGEEQLAKDFAKILINKKNKQHKIGDGSYGEVFRIDDYYVFKTFWHTSPHTGLFSKGSRNKTKNLKVYRGEVVASIGNVQIKRNVTPDKKKFVPVYSYLDDGPKMYEQSLMEFAQLPQKAYDNLASDFMTLNKVSDGEISYKFDTMNANNFIKVGKSIRIVDDISSVSKKQPNDFYSFLEIFLRGSHNEDLKKIIFKKCVLASEKFKLPMDENYKNAPNAVNHLFKNAGISESFETFYKKMMELRAHCQNDKTRIALVQEYIAKW